MIVVASRGWQVLKELARPHEAHAAYLGALQLAPGMGAIYNNLAVLATGELRLPELALRHVREGRRLAPSALDWDTPEGLALSQLQRHSEAAAALAAAARAAPASEGHACHLAIARMRVADWRQAEELLRTARGAVERGGCGREWDPLYGLATAMPARALRRYAEARAQRAHGLPCMQVLTPLRPNCMQVRRGACAA